MAEQDSALRGESETAVAHEESPKAVRHQRVIRDGLRRARLALHVARYRLRTCMCGRWHARVPKPTGICVRTRPAAVRPRLGVSDDRRPRDEKTARPSEVACIDQMIADRIRSWYVRAQRGPLGQGDSVNGTAVNDSTAWLRMCRGRGCRDLGGIVRVVRIEIPERRLRRRFGIARSLRAFASDFRKGHAGRSCRSGRRRNAISGSAVRGNGRPLRSGFK